MTPSPTPAPVSPKFTPEQEAWQKLATGTALFKDRTADDPETAPRIPLGLMIENLTDLAEVEDLVDPLVCLFPVRLADADGAPVRAVAMELEDRP